MKSFRYGLGHLAGKTVTVKELKDELDKYPDDMPVMAEWEAVTACIDPEEFSIQSISKGMEEDREDCLVIDVNIVNML